MLFGSIRIKIIWGSILSLNYTCWNMKPSEMLINFSIPLPNPSLLNITDFIWHSHLTQFWLDTLINTKVLFNSNVTGFWLIELKIQNSLHRMMGHKLLIQCILKNKFWRIWCWRKKFKVTDQEVSIQKMLQICHCLSAGQALGRLGGVLYPGNAWQLSTHISSQLSTVISHRVWGSLIVFIIKQLCWLHF